jgi:hypothetical protein
VSLVLVWRTRKFFGGDLYDRFWEEVDKAAAGDHHQGQGANNSCGGSGVSGMPASRKVVLALEGCGKV